MLSNKAEQFLIELRLYLIQNGKSDNDIQAIVEELEDHLIEAEKEGKSIESIIGENPKQYMKSIGQELPIDKSGLLVLIPASILVILAYMSFIPALEGTFRLSLNLVLWGSLLVIISLLLYAFALFKGVPKFFHSTKLLYIFIYSTSIIVSGGWVAFLFWMNSQPETPLFVATKSQNVIIALVCVLIFSLYAIYTKSWITIIVAFIISIGPVLGRVLPKEINEDPFYITLTIIVIVLISLLFGLYFYRKYRKSIKE